ncbi:conserved hypothetical protein [Rhodospirillaceae bacterium LM-1]|nr:conserved hypothetical protein [Rhodospirillaceae bacterium LM-1]
MIILASASQARMRLLADAGLEVAAEASRIDEAQIKSEQALLSFERLAIFLAQAKARDVSQRHPGKLVLGADQLLDCEGKLYDKPKDGQAAASQLRTLRGKKHRLISAAALVKDGAVLWHHVEEAVLRMRDVSDDFISSYLEREGDLALQSVGAYRLEGLGAQLFETVKGDHFTIQGLPLLALLRELRNRGELPA